MTDDPVPRTRFKTWKRLAGATVIVKRLR